MSSCTDTFPEPQQSLAQRVARILRHEMGDLLQTIYSTVAILEERLPTELQAERLLIGGLKGRAELCRMELDTVNALLAPSTNRSSVVELAPLLTSVVAQARRRYPAIPVLLDCETGLRVNADAQTLAGTVSFLLLSLCQTARRQVWVQLAQEGHRAACILERDGTGPHPDHQCWLDEPFSTTHQALLGLALASTRRTIEPCGGSLIVLPREGGGLRVRLLFPVSDSSL